MVEVVTRRLTVPVLATRDLVAVHVVLCGVAGTEQGLPRFLQDHDHEQETETERGTDPGTEIEIGTEGHTHHSHRPKGYEIRLVVHKIFDCELDFTYVVECSTSAARRHLGKFLLSDITCGRPKDTISFNSRHCGHIWPWSDKNVLEEKQV